MLDRRLVLMSLLLPGGALAQSGQSPPPEAALPQRGAPTGRVGGATRSSHGIALDVLAPERGAGKAATAAPKLHYRVSGPANRPMRATLSLATQARPLADQVLPPPEAPGLYGFTLAPSARLVAGQTYIWTVTLALDPRAPSRDVVASALLVHAPADAALQRAVAAAPLRDRAAIWAGAGFFYDAVAAAMEARAEDGGTALAGLLRSVNL